MRRTITSSWIDLVKQALADQGKSQNSLAAEVGCSTATMSILLSGGQQSSKLVEPMSEFLGVPLPPLDPAEPEVVELAGILADLDSASLEILRAMAEKLKSTK